jgi:hypothetical protein
MSERLRLADRLGGLSIVSDLGYGLPVDTALRSRLIGTALARQCACRSARSLMSSMRFRRPLHNGTFNSRGSIYEVGY